MFTGIIEAMGQVLLTSVTGKNQVIRVHTALTPELSIDQSLAHNGVCLTIVNINLQENWYEVEAVNETLSRTNLNQLRPGDWINLERALSFQGRLDGHFVQGHVDTVGQLIDITDEQGSWRMTFAYPEAYAHLLIDKGSIAINGVSLTVISPTRSTFQVAIIPYTWFNTNFQFLKAGHTINLEFDLIAKYIHKFMTLKKD